MSEKTVFLLPYDPKTFKKYKRIYSDILKMDVDVILQFSSRQQAQVLQWTQEIITHLEEVALQVLHEMGIFKNITPQKGS